MKGNMKKTQLTEDKWDKISRKLDLKHIKFNRYTNKLLAPVSASDYIQFSIDTFDVGSFNTPNQYSVREYFIKTTFNDVCNKQLHYVRGDFKVETYNELKILKAYVDSKNFWKKEAQ